MKITSRDRRINGVIACLRELEETSYYGLVDSDFLDAIDPCGDEDEEEEGD